MKKLILSIIVCLVLGSTLKTRTLTIDFTIPGITIPSKRVKFTILKPNITIKNCQILTKPLYLLTFYLYYKSFCVAKERFEYLIGLYGLQGKKYDSSIDFLIQYMDAVAYGISGTLIFYLAYKLNKV